MARCDAIVSYVSSVHDPAACRFIPPIHRTYFGAVPCHGIVDYRRLIHYGNGHRWEEANLSETSNTCCANIFTQQNLNSVLMSYLYAPSYTAFALSDSLSTIRAIRTCFPALPLPLRSYPHSRSRSLPKLTSTTPLYSYVHHFQ
jgi:hypothetical protein